MKRNELNNSEKKLYCWDFNHLFANNDEWISYLTSIEKEVHALCTLKGKLKDINFFKQHLAYNKKIGLKTNKLLQYLHYGDLDQTNLEFKHLLSLFQNKFALWNQSLTWIDPEIKAIGSEKIKDWINNDQSIAVYAHQMDLFFQFEKYILSEHDETLLSKVIKSRTDVSHFYDLLAYADRKSPEIEIDGKKQELTQTLYLDILENSDPHKDQLLRINAQKLFQEEYINKKHTFAKVYEDIINYDLEEVNIRYNERYQNEVKLTPLVYSLEADKIPLSVYNNLIITGQKHAKLVSEFYFLKKEYFNLDKFYGTDTALKLAKLPKQKYDVKTGIDMVKKALAVLGPEYLKQLEIALQPGKIDYYEDTNKRVGAYSSGGSGVEPIILMNWDDSINAINTLAHELGHSVHTLFADQEQEFPNNEYPIILAEVASTVNEHLMFDYLFQNASNKEEKIYLLQTHIETIIATFFRQIQFADFEKRAFNLVTENKSVNADVLADLFDEMSQLYGQNVLDKFDPTSKQYSWTRVLHFFHSPFYVYKYATSITVSYKLYEDIKHGKTENLLNFLKAGGSDYPLAILQKAGVDLTNVNVYQPLINNLKLLISELKILISSK